MSQFHNPALLESQTGESEPQAVVAALSPVQARDWRERNPQSTVWQVVRWQIRLLALALLLLAPLLWYWGQPVWTLSLLYGGLCVLLPTALMAYGVSRPKQGAAAQVPASAGSELLLLLFWEGVKLALAVVLLLLAPWVVPSLNWLVLVAGLALVIQSFWLALLVGRKPRA